MQPLSHWLVRLFTRLSGSGGAVRFTRDRALGSEGAGRDPYGSTLARVTVNSEDGGEYLISLRLGIAPDTRIALSSAVLPGDRYCSDQ
jgi:hypothetical protein